MPRPLILALATVVACGGQRSTTSGATTASAATATTARGNPDLITQEEVAAATGISNAFDLVRRLRPNMLRNSERTSMRTNSPAPIVRLNGQILGEVSELRSVEIGVIQEIRYYSIVQAENTFSGDRGRPVIAVTTKKLR